MRDRVLYAWRHVHWRNLRKFARSKAAQSAAVFPFIGYLAVINDKTKHLLEPPEELAHYFWITPLTQLLLIYFGLFLIGAGVIVYNLGCPFLIKRFEDENACAKFYMQMANFRQVYPMLIGLFGSPDESPNPIHREIERRNEEFSRDPEAWQKFLSTRREEVFGFYVKWYLSKDSDSPVSRAICFGSLTLGFLLLAVPSIATFTAVARAVL